MMKTRFATQGTFIVAANAVVLLLHSLAHLQLEIFLSAAGNTYVAVVMVAAPLVAAALLWSPYQRAGSLLLLASMAGSFAFGVYCHFIAHSPDHVTQVSPAGWGLIFRTTAFAMAAVEALGCAIAVAGLAGRENLADRSSESTLQGH